MKVIEEKVISIDGSKDSYPIHQMTGAFVNVKKVLEYRFSTKAPFKIRCSSIHLVNTCSDGVEINKVSEGLFEITVK